MQLFSQRQNLVFSRCGSFSLHSDLYNCPMISQISLEEIVTTKTETQTLKCDAISALFCNQTLCDRSKGNCLFVCLFQLWFSIPVNRYGHVGTLPPLYGTLTQNKKFMTSKKCLRYNHPTKPLKLISMDGLT